MFNNQIDLDTQMPIICMPIKNVKDRDQTVAILQIINSKGIQGLSATNKSKINSIDYEYLDFFSQQFSQILYNCRLMKINNTTSSPPGQSSQSQQKI